MGALDRFRLCTVYTNEGNEDTSLRHASRACVSALNARANSPPHSTVVPGAVRDSVCYTAFTLIYQSSDNSSALFVL